MNLTLYILIIIYLILCLTISIFRGRKVYSLKEYALGASQFSTSAMVATIFATGVSAGAIFGITESMYKDGFYVAIAAVLRPVYWILTGYILSRNIDKLSGCISIADVMQKVYGGISGKITTIAGIAVSIGMLTVQFTAILSIFLFVLPGHTILPIITLLVVIIYSTFGGIHSVIATDFFQFLIFYVVFPLICLFNLSEPNAIDQLFITNDYITLKLSPQDMEKFITLAIFTLIPEIDPPHIQRVLIQPSRKKIFSIYKMVSFFSIPFYISIICFGILMSKTDFTGSADNSYVMQFIRDTVPALGFNIVIIGLMAIIMSTADSYLNTFGILFTRLIGDYYKIENKELMIAKISCLVVGMMIIPVAVYNFFVFKIVFFIYNFWYPIIIIPLIAAFSGVKSNKYSFYISVIAGISAAATVGFIKGELGTASLSYGVVSSLIFFIVAQCKKKT